VIANHLSNSREQLLRQAQQEKAALKASNDRLTTQISQARQQLSQLSAATATACTQQQDALNRANQVLGATP
jgi:phage shock protein A